MTVVDDKTYALLELARIKAEAEAARRIVMEASTGYAAIHASGDDGLGGPTGTLYRYLQDANQATMKAAKEAERLLVEVVTSEK